MKRIRENELKEILEKYNDLNIYIESKEFIKLKILFKKVKITFLNNMYDIQFMDNINFFNLNLAYVEEIFLIDENKVKFKLEKDVEILLSKQS